MKRYLSIVRGTFLDSLSFRLDFLFSILGSLVGILVTYYLWRAVYGGNASLGGLGFLQAFAFVAVGGAIFSMVETWAEWGLAMSISRGRIIMDLLLPLDLHLMTVASSLGIFLMRSAFIGAPFIVFIVLVFGVPVAAGVNLVFFAVSVFFSFFISINIDYITGVTAFSFESVWGLKMLKDLSILFLSGAVIPIAFFPKPLQPVLMVLPFQAMYYTPVTLLLGGKTVLESIGLLLVQAGWIVFFTVCARLFQRRLVGKLTVSGG